MATDHNFIVKNGLEVGGVLVVNSSGQLVVANVTSNLKFNDNIRADFGNGTDLRIYHNGSTNNSNIENHTGGLFLTNYTNDEDIVFRSDDGSGGVTEYFRLDGSLTKTYFEQNVQFNDNVKLQLGAGADLSLFHNGTHSYIDNNQGSLYISSSNTVQIENSSGNDMITAQSGGAVTLFYNAFSKLATTSSGIDVTGTVTSDGLSVASDTDTISTLGRAKIGAFVTDYAYFSHIDNATSTNYALNQNSTGATSVNAKTGASVSLKINNVNKLTVDSSGNTTFVGEIYAKDSDSSADPTITFTGHTDTGLAVREISGNDELYFTTDGTARAYVNVSGLFSQGNVYTATSGDFRNYGGTWHGTTGVSGNGFVFTNTADSVTPFSLTSSGQLTLTNQPTSTYMTHLSNGQLRNESSNGYIEIGPANTSHAHIETDRSNFYFNKELRVDSGVIGSYNEDLVLRRASDAANQIIILENKIRGSNATTQGNSAMILGGIIGQAALEEGSSDHFYLPGISTNRLAGTNRRFSVTATLDGSSISIGDEAFTAGASNFQVGSLTSSSVVVITISNFGGLSYGSHAGIVFGNTTWRAKDVKIETSTDGTNYTTRTDQTNQPNTTVYKYFSSGGTATTHIRYTLTNFNTTSTRINHIFAYNYNTQDQHFTQHYKDETIYSNWRWQDTRRIEVGNGGDMWIYHDGSNSLVRNYTGDLIIQNDNDDKDIIIRTDDGSGGVTPYMTFDGSDTLTRAYKTILFQDSVKASFGNSEDMRIKHDGSNGSIDNYTGDLLFRNNVDDKDIILQSDDGSGGLADYIRLDGSDTSVRVSQHLKLPDSKAIYFGDGEDLNIWHSGTNSLIDHIGTGNLYLRNTTNDKSIYLQTDDGSGGLASYVIANGSSGTVTLTYYGSQKLITKSDGVDVTGELQADSLDIDGAGDISGNLTVHGNLTVNGSTVTNSATNTTIEDALIELGSGNTGTNSNDLGLILERGTSGNNAFIGFDESDDQVVFALTTATGSSTGNLAFSSFLPIKTGTLNTTGGVTHNVSATSEEVMVRVTNDAGHRNALTLNHEYDRDIGIHYHTSGGDYEVWMDSAGDDSLIFSPATSGNPALELYQNKKAQFYGLAQFDSTVQFNVAGTNVEFLSDTTTREVLSFKQSGTTKWLLKLKNDADLNLIPSSASSNFQINSSDFVDGSRNITVSSLTASGTSTLAAPVLVSGAHDNNGNAKLAVESGVTGAQISLYSDQIQLGNTSMNYHMKIVHDASTNGNITLWNSNLTIGSQGTNTGSAAQRDIIFAPQTSGTAVSTERMRIKGDGNVGIGISSPGQLLDVGGIIRSSATNPQVRIHTSSGTGTGYLVFGDSVDDDIGQVYYSHANNEMAFVVNAGTKMMVKSSGYVGIGTTNPADKLEVQGNIRAERIIADGSGALFRKQVDSWSTGAQTHDILYNGWTNSTGDYTYVKAAGNGLSGHGIVQVGDLGTWIGQTDLEQGALADSNTDPIDDVFAYFRSDQARIKTALGINTNTVNDKLNLYDADNNVGIYIQTATSGNASGDGLRIGLNNSHAFFWQFENSPVAIATSGTERFTILGGGNVGINNTTPSYKLDVNGETRIQNQLRIQADTPSIRFIDNQDNSDGYIQANAGTLRFYADDANEVSSSLMTWNIDGSEKMRLRSSGFLGIGATTPLDLLHIKSGSTDARAMIDGHTGFDAELKFAENGSVKYTIGHDAATDNFVIGTTNVDTEARFIINTNGDIAINRTSQLSDNKLSIQADSGEGAIGIQCNQQDGSTKLFDVYNLGGTNIYQQVLNNDTTPILIWRMYDGSSTLTERMRFTHDGKLGIGTGTGTNYKLHVKETTTNGGAAFFEDGTSWLRVVPSLGGGGFNPMSVAGDIGLIFSSDNDSSTDSGTLGLLIAPHSNSAGGIKICEDGDVGIGTTTPAFKLDVNGNVRSSGYVRVDSGGSYRLYNSAGNGWVELFFDQTNNMLQVQRGFKPSGDSQLDLGTTAVRWRNVYADNYYGSGATLTGVLTGAQDQYTGSTHPSNSFIDFDDDAGVGGATNTTTLASVGGMNFIIDSNNNGTDQFNWMHNNVAPSSAASLMTLDSSGNLDVTGQLSATTKSFDIEHPTKEGKRLHHGVLEGPEHAVYIRGKSNSYIIELPDYWEGLVHEDTITVQLTPIGGQNDMWIENIEDNKVYINCEREMKQYFYFIQAERKDVERFEVEYEV